MHCVSAGVQMVFKTRRTNGRDGLLATILTLGLYAEMVCKTGILGFERQRMLRSFHKLDVTENDFESASFGSASFGSASYESLAYEHANHEADPETADPETAGHETAGHEMEDYEAEDYETEDYETVGCGDEARDTAEVIDDFCCKFERWRRKSNDCLHSDEAFWPMFWVTRAQQWVMAGCGKDESWRAALCGRGAPVASMPPECEVRTWCALSAWYPISAAAWLDHMTRILMPANQERAFSVMEGLSDEELQELIKVLIPFMGVDANEQLLDEVVADLRTWPCTPFGGTGHADHLRFLQDNPIFLLVTRARNRRRRQLVERYTAAYIHRMEDAVATYFNSSRQSPVRRLLGNNQQITGIEDYESYELKDWAGMEEDLVRNLLQGYRDSFFPGSKPSDIDSSFPIPSPTEQELEYLYAHVMQSTVETTAAKQADAYASRLGCIVSAFCYDLEALQRTATAPLLPFLLHYTFVLDD
ncbi:putative transmembrane protein [Gregarina niphandrodes]|uniref:Transmembrane protein n=1 Tax=Gregarina niphandrodes TaxID=110365 RepID=A0A023BCD1_GRENI|nr:putative transmembrane protein [Gregarina niphandrodes]EZG82425.1 putative transmembrane protein [Gregarina niphandrodes]|eukprot:XP_011128994.1 putative transmembrane protein [Gregarina niphandrodes]